MIYVEDSTLRKFLLFGKQTLERSDPYLVRHVLSRSPGRGYDAFLQAACKRESAEGYIFSDL